MNLKTFLIAVCLCLSGLITPIAFSAELSIPLDQADRIQVFFKSKNVIAFESVTRKDFEDLNIALEIDESIKDQAQFPAEGNPDIILFKKDQRLATISYLPIIGLRCPELWTSDKKLKNPALLLKWFQARHIPEPMQMYEQTQLDEQAGIQLRDEWFAVLPTQLKPYEKLIKEKCSKAGYSPSDIKLLFTAMNQQGQKKDLQILKIFEWYGQTPGSWMAMPLYAFLPEILLGQYNDLTLQSTITYQFENHLQFSENQILGIVRYYSGWDFQKVQRRNMYFLKAQYRKQFLEFIQQTQDHEKIKLAEKSLLPF